MSIKKVSFKLSSDKVKKVESKDNKLVIRGLLIGTAKDSVNDIIPAKVIREYVDKNKIQGIPLLYGHSSREDIGVITNNYEVTSKGLVIEAVLNTELDTVKELKQKMAFNKANDGRYYSLSVGFTGKFERDDEKKAWKCTELTRIVEGSLVSTPCNETCEVYEVMEKGMSFESISHLEKFQNDMKDITDKTDYIIDKNKLELDTNDLARNLDLKNNNDLLGEKELKNTRADRILKEILAGEDRAEVVNILSSKGYSSSLIKCLLATNSSVFEIDVLKEYIDTIKKDKELLDNIKKEFNLIDKESKKQEKKEYKLYNPKKINI